MYQKNIQAEQKKRMPKKATTSEASEDSDEKEEDTESDEQKDLVPVREMIKVPTRRWTKLGGDGIDYA